MKNIFIITILFSSISTMALNTSSFCRLANLKQKAAKKELHPRRASRFRGCQKDMAWMKEVREMLCSAQVQSSDEIKSELISLNLPKVFYFTFDGAADFNASQALLLDPSIANLSGNEGRDLFAGNFNGGRNILEHIADHNINTNYESRYYAGSGFHQHENYFKAYSCIKHIDEYLDIIESYSPTDYKKPLMVTIGYSNGGIDALNLQDQMPKELDRPMDLVLTIDPIAKAAKYHTSKLWTNIGKKNNATKVHLNFYQNLDYLSLGTYVSVPILEKFYLGFKFKGKPIENADINHQFTLENNETFKFYDGAYAHVSITGSSFIWDTFQCRLDQLLLKREKSLITSCQSQFAL